MTNTPPADAAASGSPEEAQPNWRRDLEARAKAGDEAIAKLAELERREAFRDAGINVSDGVGSYFVKGYDGDLSVEAIRAEAERVGLVGGPDLSPAPSPVPSADPAEARIAAAADNAGPVANPALNDLIAQTQSPEELRALMESNGYAWNATG